MADVPVIRAVGVGKSYRTGLTASGLREAFGTRMSRSGRPPARTAFEALRDVSFEVPAGQILGVIGPNGAGKSTLLKILTRVTRLDRGEVELRGSVGSLLEVGTGFHPELTGRENVYLNGGVLGMRRREITRKLDEIVAFAEVEEFLDTPVKRYSTGMAVRLAFAVAAHLDADILLVDEVLAVGDARFQERCVTKLESLAADGGRTVLFVSHNMAPVRRMCDRVLVLVDGSLTFDGSPAEAVRAYFGGQGDGDGSGRWDLLERRNPYPPHRIVLERVVVTGPDHTLPTAALEAGAPAALHIHLSGFDQVGRGVVGVRFTSDAGLSVATMVSRSLRTAGRPGREVVTMAMPSLPLAPGRYSIDLSVMSAETGQPVDGVTAAATVDVWSAGMGRDAWAALHGDGSVVIDVEWSSRSIDGAIDSTPAADG